MNLALKILLSFVFEKKAIKLKSYRPDYDNLSITYFNINVFFLALCQRATKNDISDNKKSVTTRFWVTDLTDLELAAEQKSILLFLFASTFHFPL